jgi:hypothetical protein
MTEPVAEPAAEELLDLTVVVNGVPRHAKAPARRLLSDFLRHDLRLTAPTSVASTGCVARAPCWWTASRCGRA